jgi:hypothetical protein
MFAQFGAKFAAVRAARENYFRSNLGALTALAAAAAVLSACMPASVPLAGKDPADPSAKVARLGYRSTIAPYTSMRPSTPAPWSARNDGIAPQSKPDQ